VKDWKKELLAEAAHRKLPKEKFIVIGTHNSGPATHITTALGSDRISWWPLSKRMTLYVNRVNGQRYVAYNISSASDFFDYALSFPPCP
jgi:hypothetical protein